MAFGPLGYWLVGANGSIFAGGAAGFHGSVGNASLNQAIVGMAATPSGHGYWLVASDGGIFSFGDAAFHGSTGALSSTSPSSAWPRRRAARATGWSRPTAGSSRSATRRSTDRPARLKLNKPIVGMTSSASGHGYLLVASDGGIFAFGDAQFHGSTGALALKQPIVGIASSHTGNGYFMVAADGGIFSFGDAHFRGSAAGFALHEPIAGMAVTPTGNGYWIVAGDGTVFPFGDAKALTTAGIAAAGTSKLIVAIASSSPMTVPTALPPALPATHLKFTTQPSLTATGGTDFATQPSVKALDANGVTVKADVSDVTLAITAPAGGAIVACHVGTVTATAGLATFSGCAIDKTGTYTLTATATGLVSAESTTVDVSVGAADHLVFTNTAFAATVSGALLTPQPVRQSCRRRWQRRHRDQPDHPVGESGGRDRHVHEQHGRDHGQHRRVRRLRPHRDRRELHAPRRDRRERGNGNQWIHRARIPEPRAVSCSRTARSTRQSTA